MRNGARERDRETDGEDRQTDGEDRQTDGGQADRQRGQADRRRGQADRQRGQADRRRTGMQPGHRDLTALQDSGHCWSTGPSTLASDEGTVGWTEHV